MEVPADFFLDVIEFYFEGLKCLEVVVIAFMVVGIGIDASPERGIEAASGEILDVAGIEGAEFLVGNGFSPESEEVEVVGEEVIDGEVVECGDELTTGEIAAGTEDYNDSRGGAPMFTESLKEGMAIIVHGVGRS